MDNKKILEIIAPDGYVVEQVSEGKVTFKKVGKIELPKKWEDLGKIRGWWVSEQANVLNVSNMTTNIGNGNIFAKEEQAQAVIALAKLSQLREVYRGGWKPNWNNSISAKYSIYFIEGRVDADTCYTANNFLSFQSVEVRDQFLNNFKDLIEEASPLLFG